MPEVLDPPVEQEVIIPPIAEAPPPAGSLAERMREITNKQSAPEAKPEQRQERRQPAPKPEVKKEEVKKEEAKDEKDPFAILDELKTKGVEETETKEEIPAKTPEAEKTWKQLKAAKEAALAERDQFKKELEELKGKVSPDEYAKAKKELELLNKELGEAKNKLAQQDVRESDEYKKTVSGPIEQILGDLQGYSKAFNIPWTSLVDAMEQPDRAERNMALSQLLAQAHKKPSDPDGEPIPMDEVSKHEVVSAVNEFIQRDKIGRDLLANSATANEALKAESARKANEEKAQKETHFKKTADLVFEKMKEAIPQLKDDPKFAEEVKAAIAFKEEAPHIRAMKDIYLASAPRVIKDFKAQIIAKDQTIKELETRIQQLTGASPEVKSTEETESLKDDNRPLSEKIRAIKMGQH